MLTQEKSVEISPNSKLVTPNFHIIGGRTMGKTFMPKIRTERELKKLQLEGKADFPAEGLANTSLSWQVEAVTHDGVRLLYTDEKHREHGVRFIGDQGWVHVVRGGIRAEPATLLGVKLKPSDLHLYESHHHYNNFLECVRTRRDPVSPVEAGHVATSLTILSDIATRLGRKLVWDWDVERFVNDEVANNMLRRPMRAPWSL